jgi:hypothetical protein
MESSEPDSQNGSASTRAGGAVMLALAAGIAALVTSPFINRGTVPDNDPPTKSAPQG